MTTIKINTVEFSPFDSKALYVVLLQQNNKEFEIMIPRQFVAKKKDNDMEIITEYMAAAYAGQLLAQAGNNFGYQVPCPKSNKPFMFHLTISEVDVFADTLYAVIQGTNFHANEIGFVNFQVLASQLLNYVYQEDYECHTSGLLHIAQKMLSDL